jgi:hypothetical protein
MRNAASKLMWVGRATVFMVGLAVMLALVLWVVGGLGDIKALGRSGNLDRFVRGEV